MLELVTAPLARRTGGLAASAVGTVLRLSDGADMTALAAGSPAPETFPAAEVAEAVGRIMARPGSLQYGDTEGLWPLREWIAGEQGRLLGRVVDPAATVLAHGAQQALDLLCKAVLDPGDVVVVDRPSYVGALQVFRLFEAEVVPVPLAADDDLGALAAALRDGLRPKALYVVPNFANPSGRSLTAHQRRLLVALAARYGFLLVEDDPYGELSYRADPSGPPALAALSPEAVRIGSFSKTLFPAARLGFLTAPRPLAATLNRLKQAADLGNSTFLERIVYELVRPPGAPADRLAVTRGVYRERRDVLVDALRRGLGERLRFSVPDGGFFLWARLDDGTDATALLREALAEKVSFVPGAAFFARDPDTAALRLSFSCAEPERMATAGVRLARALERTRP
ncbi:PLP-dependent aminotransferase family protein [Streptomyces sp. CRN 30]|uniref:aminotransferase-like domain-containing protein n=1 Tax=Streptomyces sp. CRN 30 TaxID=3075613 RepID=UPI002A7EE5E4|nr:PLP-dependent aminotransferase family protein [Streptomyces sp. CRN 30]